MDLFQGWVPVMMGEVEKQNLLRHWDFIIILFWSCQVTSGLCRIWPSWSKTCKEYLHCFARPQQLITELKTRSFGQMDAWHAWGLSAIGMRSNSLMGWNEQLEFALPGFLIGVHWGWLGYLKVTFFPAFGLNMFPWMWHLVQQINCSLPLLGLNDGCGVVVLARLSVDHWHANVIEVLIHCGGLKHLTMLVTCSHISVLPLSVCHVLSWKPWRHFPRQGEPKLRNSC